MGEVLVPAALVEVRPAFVALRNYPIAIANGDAPLGEACLLAL